MDGEARGIPPTLNARQHALWVSEPDVAGRAVEAVTSALGATDRSPDLLPIATHGTLEAAAGFDAGRGVPYAQWAFYFASFRLWEHLRRSHGRDRDMAARVREAMLRFMAHHQRFFDMWDDTRERDRHALTSFTDGVLFSAAMAVGVPTAITRGQEDVLEIEAARLTGEAVSKLLSELRPEEVTLLRECGAYGEPVTRVAKRLNKGYRTVLEDYHELTARCGARLGTLLGTKDRPPWHPDVSGQVFEEPPAAANDGSPKG